MPSKRRGWEVGRDQTARLMRVVGVRGATRTRRTFTTKDTRLLQPVSTHPVVAPGGEQCLTQRPERCPDSDVNDVMNPDTSHLPPRFCRHPQ